MQTAQGSISPSGLSGPKNAFLRIPGVGTEFVDPLEHPDVWDAFVARHPGASLFHTSMWAQVLRDTYGHTPHYWVRSEDAEPSGIQPCMEVESPLTGRRGVALPFTDECPALGAAADADRDAMFEALLKLGRSRGWKYLEFRGTRPQANALPAMVFYSHRLSLERSEKELLAGLEGSVRRGIRKAENAKLEVSRGSGPEEVRAFYQLHCQTRRRHGVPPQPVRFFENISKHILQRGHGDVFAVRQGERTLAAAIFFHFGNRVIFKFGASDSSAQALRPNNLLMWEAIKSYAGSGRASLEFGRTSLFAEGLRRFKLGFGPEEGRSEYFRYDLARNEFVTGCDRSESWINPFFRCMPLPLLRIAGRWLYPHLS